MKIYVAGRTKNIDEVHTIQEVVMERGHQITHDWTDPSIGEVRDSWKEDPERARQVATLDFIGCAQADGIILCGYGCEEGGGGLGCFIEVGIGLASGVPLIVLGPARESVFWYSPFTLRVNYLEDKVVIDGSDPDFTGERSAEDIIKLEAAIAINGLESLQRQKALSLGPTDTSVNL